MQEAETVTALEQGKPVTFEAQRDAAIAQLRESIQNLRVLLTKNFLVDQYKTRTAALDAEDVALQTEFQVLSESRDALAPITSAKVRVLQRLGDDKMALGDTAEAREKEEEARGVQEKFDAVTERIRLIELRREEIVKDKCRLARAIFEEVYPSLPISSFAMLESVLDLLDGFKTGMFSYQTLTGLDPTSLRDQPLIRNFHVEKLIPGQASGRQLAYRIAEWFR